MGIEKESQRLLYNNDDLDDSLITLSPCIGSKFTSRRYHGNHLLVQTHLDYFYLNDQG